MSQPHIIDGKAVAAAVLDEVRAETAALKARGITPGLAVVLVGEDPASKVYVGAKDRTCQELGLHSKKITLPAETTQAELIAVVQELNADPLIHGILVQSPPPKHIDLLIRARTSMAFIRKTSPSWCWKIPPVSSRARLRAACACSQRRVWKRMAPRRW
jgi:hypothetical protein